MKDCQDTFVAFLFSLVEDPIMTQVEVPLVFLVKVLLVFQEVSLAPLVEVPQAPLVCLNYLVEVPLDHLDLLMEAPRSTWPSRR